jgi:hypothetical protein
LLDELKNVASRHQADADWHDTVLDGVVLLLRDLRSQREQAAVDAYASEMFCCVDDVELSDLADISDHVLSRVAASEGRLAGENGLVGSKVSNALAACASGATGLVYDPACGIAETLLKTWRNAGTKGVELLGHDINAHAVVLARQRCLLHGVSAKILRADVLSTDPDPSLRADVIVAEPPLGIEMPRNFSVTDARWAIAGPPPPKNSELAWLQHTIAHLAPEGRGYVVTNANTAFAANTAKFRRSLLGEGCIEAVVGLPPKMLPNTTIPTVLWVLCRPGASRFPDSVLVIDASAMTPSGDLSVRDWITDPTELDSTRASWTISTVMEVLADDDVSLSPRGLTETKIDPTDVWHRYREAVTQLQNAPRAINVDDLVLSHSVTALSYVMTVRQLERQGTVAVVPARARGNFDTVDADGEENDPRVVTPSMLAEGLPTLSAGQPIVPHRDKTLTEPGDVLVTTIRTIRAIVDDVGGRLLRSGVIRVRVDTTELDPHYVAACLAGTWNQRFEKGLYSPNANIRDLEIPLIPLPFQQEIVRYVDRARRTAAAAHSIAAAAQQVADVFLEGVRFNVDL